MAMLGKELEGHIMSGALKESWASWRDAHGFGILCVISQRGECFIIVPSPTETPLAHPGDPPWRGLSESGLRGDLAKRGVSNGEVDEAIQMAREWATTITGSGSSLWPLAD